MFFNLIFSLDAYLLFVGSCERGRHMIQYSNVTFPCPIFNVRINFTATEVLFHRPRISTSISWDYPHGMYGI